MKPIIWLNFHDFPEFRVFADKLGIGHLIFREFEIHIGIDDPVRYVVDGESTLVAVCGYELYHWSEFRDLCRRLGIWWEAPTKAISLRFAEGESASVTHVYLMEDLPQDVDPPVIVTS